MYSLLREEILLLEIVREVPGITNPAHRRHFAFKFTTLQGNETVGQGIALFLADVLAGNLHQVNQRHDSAGDHIVVLVLDVLHA